MALAPQRATPTEIASGRSVPALRLAVFGLFFLFGGITSLNDVLIPKLKGLFSLNHSEAMLIQSAFFGAYFLISFPAGMMVRRIGYLRAAVVGLGLMAAGCLLFVPAAATGAFMPFLGALFIVAAGITVVQVVANPLISALGPPALASSRLTFAQAFNSVGTTIMPWIGAVLILGPAASQALSSPAEEGAVVGHAYVGLAIVLLIVAATVWVGRNSYDGGRAAPGRLRDALSLLAIPRFAFGTGCIFLYVGAEVTIGSLLATFLMQPHVLALDPESAGKHIAYYWGGALVGRFVGAFALQRLRPGLCLSAVAIGAIVLIAIAGAATGHVAAWALIAIGLMNAIQFPTIFTLASEGLGDRTAEASGIICMAIVGGAVVPLLTGAVADQVGLSLSLAVPALCYAAICLFGLYAQRPAPSRGPA